MVGGIGDDDDDDDDDNYEVDDDYEVDDVVTEATHFPCNSKIIKDKYILLVASNLKHLGMCTCRMSTIIYNSFQHVQK